MTRARALAGVLHKNKDGRSKRTEYTVWLSMRQRCLNPNATKYPSYGGRGITICERWNEFNNFLADMGHRPTPAHTLDRKKNDLGYSPENCRWATRKEQQNNRGCNVRLTYLGKTQTMTEWAEELGIGDSTIWGRIAKNWPIEKVLSKEKFADLSGLALGVEARRKKRAARL